MPKSILIIEDEEEIAQLYVARLEAVGYKTAVALDGIQGIIELEKHKPDLILLDVSMPYMDGMDFYRHICQPNCPPDYPVVVITARMDMHQLFQEFYVDGFITKPFDPKRFMEEVSGILEQTVYKKTDRQKRAVIVDNDDKNLKEIADVFAVSYQVNTASSGLSGIEEINRNLPDVALISMGLSDITGDVLVTRLKYMARTKHTQFILYTRRLKSMRTAAIGAQTYTDPQELLEIAERMLQEHG